MLQRLILSGKIMQRHTNIVLALCHQLMVFSKNNLTNIQCFIIIHNCLIVLFKRVIHSPQVIEAVCNILMLVALKDNFANWQCLFVEIFRFFESSQVIVNYAQVI